MIALRAGYGRSPSSTACRYRLEATPCTHPKLVGQCRGLLVELWTPRQEEVIKFFDELLEQHPSSDSLKRLVLHFITGQRFQRRLGQSPGTGTSGRIILIGLLLEFE